MPKGFAIFQLFSMVHLSFEGGKRESKGFCSISRRQTTISPLDLPYNSTGEDKRESSPGTHRMKEEEP